MQFDIKLQGFKELDDALAKLPNRVAGKTLQRSVNAAMREGKKAVKKAAPIAEQRSPQSLKYGRLSENIKSGRARANKKSEKVAYVSTGDAFWGWFLERGTRFMAANPWFMPAFESVQSKILDVLKEKLAMNIDREFKKLAK